MEAIRDAYPADGSEASMADFMADVDRAIEEAAADQNAPGSAGDTLMHWGRLRKWYQNLRAKLDSNAPEAGYMAPATFRHNMQIAIDRLGGNRTAQGPFDFDRVRRNTLD